MTNKEFDKQFNQTFPPSGGCPCEYKPIFEPYFTIKTMDECYNSIPSGEKIEVFINLEAQEKSVYLF
jgi:hypothetical protein